jgi:hypothetical protein
MRYGNGIRAHKNDRLATLEEKGLLSCCFAIVFVDNAAGHDVMTTEDYERVEWSNHYIDSLLCCLFLRGKSCIFIMFIRL